MAEGTQQVMARRAAALAQPAKAWTGRRAGEGVVVMEAAGARYAVAVGQVRRVLPTGQRCRLPAGCGQLLTLVATPEGTVPVTDLAALLQGAQPDPGRAFLVVVGTREDPVGLLVDSVDTVAGAAPRVRPLPAGTTDGSHPAAVGLLGDDVLLLDLPLLLDDDRLRVPAAPAGHHRAPDAPGEP